MRNIDQLAHHLNGMEHEHFQLSARDIDDLSAGTMTAADIEQAVSPKLHRPGFTFRVFDGYDGRPAVWITRPSAVQPVDLATLVPDGNPIDLQLSRWREHMVRFEAAHVGQPNDRLLIELEKRESWARMMPQVAGLLEAPDSW